MFVSVSMTVEGTLNVFGTIFHSELEDLYFNFIMESKSWREKNWKKLRNFCIIVFVLVVALF